MSDKTKPRHYIVMNMRGSVVAVRDTRDEAIAAMGEAIYVSDDECADNSNHCALYITTSKERVPL